MDPQFNSAFILSGGGTRSMIYLGMLAALEELNMKPDLLIATCGGAFAATVINTFSDHQSRKAFMKSEEYFQFSNKIQVTEEKKLFRIGLFSLKKMIEKRNAPYIEDVFENYLVEMNQDLSADFPSLKNTTFSQEIPTLIIGSEILFDAKEIGSERREKKLYRKIIFTNEDLANLIDLEKTAILSENYKKSAVSETTKIKTNFSMLESTRISVSDMFYVAPVSFNDQFFAGGAIDLIPIELAKFLAKKVIIEKKLAYSPVEESFVRSVLGYSGNERLAEIQNQKPDHQIETQNIKQKLDGHYIKKKINWRKLEISFDFHPSFEKFQKDMDLQWEYGFNQTLNSIKNKKSL